MIALAELPCLNMYFSWIYPCYWSSEPGPGRLLTSAALRWDFEIPTRKKVFKSIQVFLLEEYPSKRWAQLVAMSQELGTQKGQGMCWQLELRRQKRMRQSAISPSVPFFFLLQERWRFVWWECTLYFQYLLWPLINMDWFCEDLKSLTFGWLYKSTIKRC